MKLNVAGAETFVYTGGVEPDPALPAVVMVHGAGMDHSVWRFQARALAHAGLRVYAVDLAGHGKSEGKAPTSIAAAAAWVAEFADVLDLDRLSVVGHSMGSLIGIELAADTPNVVDRLVLVGTSGEMAVHPDLLAAAEAGDHLAVELIVGWSFGTAGRTGGHPQAGTWLPAAAVRLLERALDGPLGSDLAACAAYPGLDRAAEVSAPTLVIQGAEDRMTPVSAARRLVETMPDARLEVIPAAGHMVMVEAPDQVRRLLEDFLAG